MFTGIVEETGRVLSFSKNKNGANLALEAELVLAGVKVGDSISINGVCQTVVDFNKNRFCVNISDETLDVTTFKNLKVGQIVNLERALTLNSRLGGHIVSGHVDCCAVLSRVEKLSDFYNLEFELPDEKLKYVVEKGSVAIDGISLTVASVFGNKIKVAIIPHTYKNTNLQSLKIGDRVNVETDILAKYVEKILIQGHNENADGKINISFLEQNGFI